MYKHQELTREVIKAAHNVHNELGHGFLEKIYHNVMVLELRKMGLDVTFGEPISI